MSKHSQRLPLLAVSFTIFAVLAGKSEYSLARKNTRSILETASYRMVSAMGMIPVISSGAMDLPAGFIVSLRGVLIAPALHGGMGIWASVLTGIAAGGLMGALNGVLTHCMGTSFFALTLISSGILRGTSLITTDGKPITKFGKEFMQLGIGRIEEFQTPVLLALALILLSFPLMFHVKWRNYVRALGGSGSTLKRLGVRTGFYRILVHMFLGITAAVTAVIITVRLNFAEPNIGMNMELDVTTAVTMGGTLIRGGDASIAGTVLAVLMLGSIRNGLTFLSASSDLRQWIIGSLLLASVLISEIGVWDIKVLTK